MNPRTRPFANDSFDSGPRWPGMVLVIAVHVAILVALLSYQPVRAMIGLKPLMVEFITPPAPPVPEPPKEIPKPREVQVIKRKPEPPKPQQIMTAQTEAPVPTVSSPPEPPKPLPPVEAAPPPAPPAPPAAPAPPRVVTGIEYTRPPKPVYPQSAQRMREEGTATLRVCVDIQGRPESVSIQRSSGSQRLDDAARSAMFEARFKPYTDNGKPEAVCTNGPITFSLP